LRTVDRNRLPGSRIRPEDAKRVALDPLDRRAVAEMGEVLEVARLDILTEPYLERDLERKPEEYAGVSEVAALLGVSRQRVSELRARDGFPEPIADLAAGPVWAVSSLKSFVANWPRKPGRPARRAPV